MARHLVLLVNPHQHIQLDQYQVGE